MKRISCSILFFCLAFILSAVPANAKENRSDTVVNRQLIKVTPFSLLLLPPSSGIQFYRNGIVFLSSSKYEEKMVSDHLSFGTVNAYYAPVEDTVLGPHTVFFPSVSFAYPSEAITFSSDYNTMYFTKISDEDGVEKIYKAIFLTKTGSPGNWSDDNQPLAFCIGKSNYTHPALSVDGKFMIFSSDRRSSVGDMDLFLTRKEGEKWSDPVNLGETINTKTNELFPFLDSENNLFFSSEGLKGFGGYDVFVCKFTGDTWEKPVNLLKPVNTIYDDIAFTVNRNDGKSAFYTVKQRSRKKSLQLYLVTINNFYTSENLSGLSQIFIPPDKSDSNLPKKITALTSDSGKKSVADTETKTELLKKETEVKPKHEIKTDKPLNRIKSSDIPEKKTTTAEKTKANTTEPSGKKDVIVYRVQILSSSTPKGSYKITANNIIYNTFEYLYKGGYRTCAGEFRTLAPAKDLQNSLRKTGYPQAFVVVFKNNVRSADPLLFK